MVKGYLKYTDGSVFSAMNNTVQRKLPTIKYQDEMCLITAANEIVHLISAKTGETKLSVPHPDGTKLALVTAIEPLQSLDTIMVGYSNGDIMVYNLKFKDHSMFQKHENSIERMVFWGKELFNWVVSYSNDKKVVVWDIQSAEEVYEIRNHSSPIADLVILDDSLVTIGKDGILRQFDLRSGILSGIQMTNKNELNMGLMVDMRVGDNHKAYLLIVAIDEILLYDISDSKLTDNVFTINREVFTKILQIERIGKTILILTSTGLMESYKVLDKAEVIKKYKRKAKRGVKDLPTEEEYVASAANYITSLKNLTVDKDCKAFTLLKGKNGSVLFTTSFNNHIAVYKLQEFEIAGKLKDMTFGHLYPVNWGIISSTDEFLVTGSLDTVIVWETYSCTIVKRFDVQNSTTATYLPGDRLIAIGTAKGHVVIYSTDTSEAFTAVDIEDAKGKKISVNSIKLLHASDKAVMLGVVCSDKTFRRYKLVKASNGVYGLDQVDVISLVDEPLKLEYIPKTNKLIVSFMDNSLRSYFNDDKAKEDVQYYGHSLQVTDFAISSDEYVLASVSRDKSLRIWDIKFGNCRRIINSVHQGGVSCIQIVRDTHYAFTGGRENQMKFWDLDTFELVMVFDGHMGTDIRSLVVSKIGDLVFSLGKNKTIRKYVQTKEQVFASEFKDEQEEKGLYLTGVGADDKIDEDGVIEKRVESLKTAENYMDLIERVEKDHNEAYTAFEEDLLLGKKRPALVFNELDELNPAEYVLKKLSQIPKHRLDSIFMFFHFNTFKVLLNYVRFALQNRTHVDLGLYIVKFALNKQATNIFKGEGVAHTIAKCVELLKVIYEEKMERERYLNEGLGVLVKETGYYTA